MKLKIGDTIIVTSGKDKGKKGKIQKLFPALNSMIIPGINIYKRHMKKRDEKKAGGIIDLVRPIGIGHVSLVCPSCGKQTRIKMTVAGKDKYRICAKCGQKI